MLLRLHATVQVLVQAARPGSKVSRLARPDPPSPRVSCLPRMSNLSAPRQCTLGHTLSAVSCLPRMSNLSAPVPRLQGGPRSRRSRRPSRVTANIPGQSLKSGRGSGRRQAVVAPFSPPGPRNQVCAEQSCPLPNTLAASTQENDERRRSPHRQWSQHASRERIGQGGRAWPKGLRPTADLTTHHTKRNSLEAAE